MADVIYPAHDAAFRISASGQLEFQREIRMSLGGVTPTVLELSAVLPVSLMPGRHDQSAQGLEMKVSTERLEEVRRIVAQPYAAGAHPVPSSAWERG
jgi:hypothetical protein